MLEKLKSLVLGRRNWANALSIVVLAALVFSLLERSLFLAETLALLRPQFTGVLLVLAGFFAWRKRWPWMGAAAGGTLLGAILFLPHWAATAPHAKAEEGQPVLTVFCHNVKFDSENQEQVIATIQELKPDVVVLLEVTGTWEKPLKELERLYPADLFEFRADPFGIAFLTRLPVVESKLEDYSGYELLSTLATLEFAGEKITVIGTHPPPPVANTLAEVSDWHLRDLAKDIVRRKEPVLVIGDFNMAPGLVNYGKFLKASELRSAGNPWKPTWSVFKLPILGVRMDHHFVSDQWKTVRTKVGQFDGSDHRWVYSELVLAD